MGDMFPILTKFTKLQVTDKEQQHMFRLCQKEKTSHARNEVYLHRKEGELLSESLKCADMVNYLDFQKLLNLKIATITMAETAMLERRLEMAKLALIEAEKCLEHIQSLVAVVDKVYVKFLRDVARKMGFEKLKDIINRHVTLINIKNESLEEFHQTHAKLHALREKDATVREERLKESLVLYNKKRELFREWQELEHKEFVTPKTNVLDMLDEIAKEIHKKTIILETVTMWKNKPDPNRQPSLRTSFVYYEDL